MSSLYLSLGSNLGDRHTLLLKAIDLLARRVGRLVRASSFIETEPWGFHSPHRFLNAVVLLQTSLSPEAVLAETQAIECLLGRTTKTPAIPKPITSKPSAPKPTITTSTIKTPTITPPTVVPDGFPSGSPSTPPSSSPSGFPSAPQPELVISGFPADTLLPPYDDRPIDIDILLYDDLHLSTPELTIPHPHMYERDFVLRPLREVQASLAQ